MCLILYLYKQFLRLGQNLPLSHPLLYDSMICSIFNYASSVWQIGNTNSLEKINEVQRKGLALCLDLPTQSSLEALEVVSNTLPVDLRREEIAIRQDQFI